MCVAVRVEYPVTMMNCKTCVILYFSWTFKIQHKQEYRVSHYIYVIYVRGHVRHDDKRIQSSSSTAFDTLPLQATRLLLTNEYPFFDGHATTTTTANDCAMRRDDNERQSFPNQNAPLARSGTPEILFSLAANDSDAAQAPTEKCRAFPVQVAVGVWCCSCCCAPFPHPFSVSILAKWRRQLPNVSEKFWASD